MVIFLADFCLPKRFFENKMVIDVGCGNGRIGRIVAPLCKNTSVVIYLNQYMHFRLI